MTAGTDLHGVSDPRRRPNVTSQLFGSGLIGLREGLETAIVVTILVAFLVKADRRDALKWVWLGVAAAVADDRRGVPGHPVRQNTITGLAAEAIAGIASLVAVAIVTTMVLWMKKAAAVDVRRAARRHGARRWRRAAGGARRWRSSPSAARASRPRCSWSATPRPRPSWPLIGLLIGVLRRRRDRLRHVLRRDPHQLREVLQVHRRLPDRRRRRNPRPTASARCRPSAGCPA